MKKKYYIEDVKIYNIAYRDAYGLADYVDKTYSRSFVDEESIPHIANDIRQKAKQLEETNSNPINMVTLSKFNDAFAIHVYFYGNMGKEMFSLWFQLVQQEYRFDAESNTCKHVILKGGEL